MRSRMQYAEADRLQQCPELGDRAENGWRQVGRSFVRLPLIPGTHGPG